MGKMINLPLDFLCESKDSIGGGVIQVSKLHLISHCRCVPTRLCFADRLSQCTEINGNRLLIERLRWKSCCIHRVAFKYTTFERLPNAFRTFLSEDNFFSRRERVFPIFFRFFSKWWPSNYCSHAIRNLHNLLFAKNKFYWMQKHFI